MNHDTYEMDILKQLKKIAAALEVIAKEMHKASAEKEKKND